MGNLNCCSQSTSTNSKTRIVTSNVKNSGQNKHIFLPDNSSTSDSETVHFQFQTLFKSQKSDNFSNFITQKSIDISSITKISQCSECFSQHKTFIKYVQKYQKEISQRQDLNDEKRQKNETQMDKNLKANMKLFIEHSNQCAICYELYQNLKNMEIQQNFISPIESDENRISLRDSLLEFEQCEKAKRCAECKCQVLNSQDQAVKALRKYPNTNKYQSKNLKFRKTSMFELQITQERQSQESS